MICPIYEASINTPKKIFIQTETTNLSYHEANQEIQKITTFISKNISKKSTSLAFICKNSLLDVLIIVACFRLNIQIFPLNFRLPENKITELIQNLDIDIVINMPFIEHSISLELKKISLELALKKEPIPKYTITKAITFLLTSGSTNEPKIAIHSLKNYISNAEASNKNLNLNSTDSWALTLPLFHVGGISILIRSLLAHSKILISDTLEWKKLISMKPSFISLVPTQLTMILNSSNIKFLKTMKVILIGGAPINSNLIEKALQHNLPIYLTYGLTEASSQVATKKVTSIEVNNFGPISPTIKFKISKNKELLLKGKSIFIGYQNQIKQKKAWFYTGDLGELNKKNEFILLGRKDNMFISGGENIQPEEIETQLCEFENITQAIVIPKKDSVFGHIPIAIIENKKNQTLNQNELDKIKLELSKTLPRYKIPKYIVINNAFFSENIKPKRSSIKIWAENLDYVKLLPLK